MDGIQLSFPPESPPLSVIVALSLSASQVTIDSSAAATTVPSVAFSNRWESFSKSKKYWSLVRWFKSILDEYSELLNKVVTTYVKESSGKPVAPI